MTQKITIENEEGEVNVWEAKSFLCIAQTTDHHTCVNSRINADTAELFVFLIHIKKAELMMRKSLIEGGFAEATIDKFVKIGLKELDEEIKGDA